MTKQACYESIQAFVNLAVENGAIEELDKIYLRNQLLHFLAMNEWQEPNGETPQSSDSLSLMSDLLELAKQNGAIPEGGEEAYQAALMDFICPLPSQINQKFWEYYKEAPKLATDYFYSLTKKIDQVKTQDIARNISFSYPSNYGDLEITINLSKPEKDPKAIAALKKQASTVKSDYPACPLCVDNEGFYGTAHKAARSNHRLIRLKLEDEDWAMQYSPYAYYNEHAIVLNQQHIPMSIKRETFKKLLDFLDLFPHYMIGSNADLPIVGGSILNHDHYQAGRHIFPMMKAGFRTEVELQAFPEVRAGIVDWPMSVLRLSSKNKSTLVEAADFVLNSWKNYSDEALSIIAQTPDGESHHTVTPIAYMHEDNYQIDLVLRDNNVSAEYPDGIFHPHQELHHIKKENIGLIEVMGLAILPPRLLPELKEVKAYILGEKEEYSGSHKLWADRIKKKYHWTSDNAEELLHQEVGQVFEEVLKDAGVFKDDELGRKAFLGFIHFLNFSKKQAQ